MSSDPNWLGPIASLVAALLAAGVTLAASLGRRQRLRMAIDLKDSVHTDQRPRWDRMIRRDVEAVLKNSDRDRLSSLLYAVVAFYFFGSLLLVWLLPSYRILRIWSVVMGIVFIGVFAVFFWRLMRMNYLVKKTFNEYETPDNPVNRISAIVDTLQADEAAATSLIVPLLYRLGAPIKTVHRAERGINYDQFYETIDDRGQIRWNIRALIRRLFALRSYDYSEPRVDMLAKMGSLTKSISASQRELTSTVETMHKHLLTTEQRIFK